MKINLKNLLSTYSYYLIPFIVVIIMIVVFVNIDVPKLSEIDQIRQQLSSINERLDSLSAKSKVLSGLDETKITEQLERTKMVLPDGKDAPSILRSLEAAASSSGIFVENLDLAPGRISTGGGDLNENNGIPIKVVVIGTTLQVTTYLSNIGKIGRAMDLKSLEAVYTESTESAKVNLELVAYFLSPKDIVGKVSDPLPAWGDKEDNTLTEIFKREVLAPVIILPPSVKSDLFK